MSKHGMMMTGTNGSQLWDASFIAQALYESDLGSLPENRASTEKLLEWLDGCQIQANPKHFKEAYRHRSEGAWPFSTSEQSYTVSDCTAEGMKSVLLLQKLPSVPDSSRPFPVRMLTSSPSQPPPRTRVVRPPVRRRRHDPLAAEPGRGLCVVRADPRQPAARAAEPGRGVCQHHDRVPLCRMHDGV